MSDQSTPFRASTSVSRLVAGLGSLLPALSVLAIVAGGFWFLVDLTISPLKDDLEGLKGLKLGSRLASIEATLQSINLRFGQIDGRFEQIDGRFERMDGRLDRMDGRFDRIDRKFDRIDRKFDRIDGRLQVIEAKQDDLIEATARLDGRVDSLDNVVRGGLIVRESLPDPEGKANEETPRPG